VLTVPKVDDLVSAASETKPKLFNEAEESGFLAWMTTSLGPKVSEVVVCF
jgi:uncharacterized membrane protein YidH (DUF202 family)